MPRLGIREIFGLKPLRPALEQMFAAVVGDEHAPPSRFGTSSLRILTPRQAVPLWLGRPPCPGKALVSLLPNRTPFPAEQGYSVRVTRVRDFRGRELSYDSHMGTDFAVPAGTEVTAPAAGIVRWVANHMQRGGLKVCIDHGAGLLTTCNHLARALVAEGDAVARGQLIGLSGMSSIDGVLFFPWLAPHVHVNVLLDGKALDPWAAPGEVSSWRQPNDPSPADTTEAAREPTAFCTENVDAIIATCCVPALRAELEAIEDPAARGARLAFRRFFMPYAFSGDLPLTVEDHAPVGRLDLPFRDLSGVVFLDDL